MIDAAPALRGTLGELVPLLRRASGLDPACLCRLRHDGAITTLFVQLPFRVLVSRAVRTVPAERVDVTVRAAELLRWAEQGGAEQGGAEQGDAERDGAERDGAERDGGAPPEPRDLEWRGALPPQTGWRPVDSVPDDVVRGLVRSGAVALREAAPREGVPGTRPRAAVADALLDAVVLTVTEPAADLTAAITLRTLSALTRMGFLARNSHADVDRAGRWTRVSGRYGSVYAQQPGGLTVLP